MTSDISRRLLVVGVVAFGGFGTLGVSGCGSDSGNTGAESEQAVELRIARERKDAADRALQKERLKELQAEVKKLHKRDQGKTVVVPGAPPATAGGASVPAASTSNETRAFHVPSGNVSCEIAGGEARCTVARIGSTFVLPANGAAYTEGGGLPRGSGSLVGWASTVTAGDISCVIPAESEARGIRCSNSNGHGFEASSVSARQKTY